MKTMNDIYIYRMSLLAMQARQLHEDINELLQHYHDDSMAGGVAETVAAGTAMADTRSGSPGIGQLGSGKCNSLPE